MYKAYTVKSNSCSSGDTTTRVGLGDLYNLLIGADNLTCTALSQLSLLASGLGFNDKLQQHR